MTDELLPLPDGQPLPAFVRKSISVRKPSEAASVHRRNPKWQYLIVEIPSIASNNDVFNAISQPGGDWELISVVYVPPDRESLKGICRHYFKRPYEPESPSHTNAYLPLQPRT